MSQLPPHPARQHVQQCAYRQSTPSNGWVSSSVNNTTQTDSSNHNQIMQHVQACNKRVRPLRGRLGPSLQLSKLTCVLFWGFLGLCKAGRDPYTTCQISSWSDNRRRSYGDFSPTTQLAAVTLTPDPLTLKLVHGVLVSRDPSYQVWYS